LGIIAAIDLGGTAIKGALFDGTGPLTKKNHPTEAKKGYGHVLQNIDQLIQRMADNKGIKVDEIRSVGVGVPAFMAEQGRRVVLAPNLGWSDVDFASDLAEQMQKPVFCNNDANLAALGEHWQGNGKDIENLLMVTIGTGIGSGLILNGELYQGKSGMAVEVGHMVIMAEGSHRCSCGRQGCVEALTAAPAIVREAKKLMDVPTDCLPDVNITEAKQVYQAAASGDKRALQVVEKAAYFLGVALANILNFYELDVIIIGGGVAQAGDILLNPLRRTVARETVFFQRRPTEILPGMLGNDAGVFGAARWAALGEAKKRG